MSELPLGNGQSQQPEADQIQEHRPWLSALYQRYWQELCRFIHAKFGAGPPEPEDVAQLAFTKLAAHKNPEEIHDPRAFLYQIARNIAVDYGRYSGRRERILRESIQVSVEKCDDFSPERVLISKEEFSSLEAAIKKLPPRHRSFLLMNRLENLSYAEIGRRAGMSPSGVRRIVEQALTQCLRTVRTDNLPKSQSGRQP